MTTNRGGRNMNRKRKSDGKSRIHWAWQQLCHQFAWVIHKNTAAYNAEVSKRPVFVEDEPCEGCIEVTRELFDAFVVPVVWIASNEASALAGVRRMSVEAAAEILERCVKASKEWPEPQE